MTLPGFTADSSLYPSRHHYRTPRGTAASASRTSIMLQQDKAKDPGGAGAPAGHCCGTYCHGLCVCSGGHGYCGGHEKEPDTSPLTILRPPTSVAMAIDACHADEPINGSYAYAACSCGCWATTHDAGCFPCGHTAVAQPDMILAPPVNIALDQSPSES